MKPPNEILSAVLDTNEKASLEIIRESQREAYLAGIGAAQKCLLDKADNYTDVSAQLAIIEVSEDVMNLVLPPELDPKEK